MTTLTKKQMTTNLYAAVKATTLNEYKRFWVQEWISIYNGSSNDPYYIDKVYNRVMYALTEED
jgi:hypothetical protein